MVSVASTGCADISCACSSNKGWHAVDFPGGSSHGVAYVLIFLHPLVGTFLMVVPLPLYVCLPVFRNDSRSSIFYRYPEYFSHCLAKTYNSQLLATDSGPRHFCSIFCDAADNLYDSPIVVSTVIPNTHPFEPPASFQPTPACAKKFPSAIIPTCPTRQTTRSRKRGIIIIYIWTWKPLFCLLLFSKSVLSITPNHEFQTFQPFARIHRSPSTWTNFFLALQRFHLRTKRLEFSIARPARIILIFLLRVLRTYLSLRYVLLFFRFLIYSLLTSVKVVFRYFQPRYTIYYEYLFFSILRYIGFCLALPSPDR